MLNPYVIIWPAILVLLVVALYRADKREHSWMSTTALIGLGIVMLLDTALFLWQGLSLF